MKSLIKSCFIACLVFHAFLVHQINEIVYGEVCVLTVLYGSVVSTVSNFNATSLYKHKSPLDFIFTVVLFVGMFFNVSWVVP